MQSKSTRHKNEVRMQNILLLRFKVDKFDSFFSLLYSIYHLSRQDEDLSTNRISFVINCLMIFSTAYIHTFTILFLLHCCHLRYIQSCFYLRGIYREGRKNKSRFYEAIEVGRRKKIMTMSSTIPNE